MSPITTIRELVIALQRGARLYQAYMAPYPGAARRDTFYVERGGSKEVLSTHLATSAVRYGRITAGATSNGIAPREWRLSTEGRSNDLPK